jgi:hypothetical protein
MSVIKSLGYIVVSVLVTLFIKYLVFLLITSGNQAGEVWGVLLEMIACILVGFAFGYAIRSSPSLKLPFLLLLVCLFIPSLFVIKHFLYQDFLTMRATLDHKSFADIIAWHDGELYNRVGYTGFKGWVLEGFLFNGQPHEAIPAALWQQIGKGLIFLGLGLLYALTIRKGFTAAMSDKALEQGSKD